MKNCKFPRRKTHSKAFWCIFITLVIVILTSSSLVSALEWDNVKDYDPETKTVTINNAFNLPIIGYKIADIQLISNTEKCITNCEAEIKLDLKVDYTNPFKKLNFYNYFEADLTPTNLKEFKILRKTGTKEVQVPNYVTTCELIKGKTNCISTQSGTKAIIQDVYEEYKGEELIIGEHYFKITGVKDPYENVEWIPTFLGRDISEWASWNSSFEEGLLAYYWMNDTEENHRSTWNLSVGIGSPSFGSTNCLIGDCGTIDGSSSWNITTEDDLFDFQNDDDNNLSINFWFRPDVINSGASEVTLGKENVGPSGWRFRRPSGDGKDMTFEGMSVANTLNDVMTATTWTMFTFSGNNTGGILYADGVALGHTVVLDYFDSGGNVVFGASVDGTLGDAGKLDELSFWNRTLTASEVTDLYNGGTGLTLTAPVSPTSPTITLNAPADGANFSMALITINCSATDPDSNLINITFFLDDAVNETITNSSANQNLSFETMLTFSQGTHTWNCTTTDLENQIGETTGRTFDLDSVLPEINITFPIDGSTITESIGQSSATVEINWTVSDTNLQACWYFNQSVNVTVTCGENATISLPYTTHTHAVYSNDSFGNENFNFSTATYEFILQESNETFNFSVFETDLEGFTLNISSSLDILSVTAVLDYNNTDFTGTSDCDSVTDTCLINVAIDLPLVTSPETEQRGLFWKLSIFNGTTTTFHNTTVTYQNVTRIHLEECNTTYSTISLNFTSLEERNQSRIDPFFFDGDFDFWLGGGSITQSNSFSKTNVTELNLCVSPTTERFWVDSTINYNEPVNETYTTRSYYFQNDTINSTQQDIPLYLLQSASSTTFILKVQDQNLLPVADALIIIQKFFPGEGVFKTVQISKTDGNGQTVGFFETETVDYRFRIQKHGVILLPNTSPRKIVGETAPFTIIFNIGEDEGTPWEDFEEIIDLTATLVFQNSTKQVIYTYVDSSGDFEQARLWVFEQNFSGPTINTICNSTSSQSSATITCSVNATTTYTAISYITRSSIEVIVDTINFTIQSISETLGLFGVFLAWFIILVASFTFKFNEIAGIWMTTIAVIFVNMIGLVAFGLVFITAIIGISIFLTIMMSR